MDDGMIVDLFLLRDERAIEAVREKYGDRLKGVAMRILSGSEDAEECVSDAYFEAWRRIPPHEPREYLFPFLARMVKASALNRVKAMGREKRSAVLVELTEELESVLPSDSTVEEDFDAKELRNAVNSFLRELDDETRAVFVLRYWELMDLKAIALRLGFTQGKVKSVLFRTRGRLAKYLKKEGFLQ